MLVVLVLAGCAELASYTLVKPGPVPVAHGSMTVSPSGDWNRAPVLMEPRRIEETWTRNGLVLDEIRFIGGLPDGQALVAQSAKADQQLPVFSKDMTPSDLTSMLESVYRIRGGVKVFTTTAVKPVSFVGHNGIEYDYDYITEDSIRWRGRTVMAVVDGKLYLMSLQGLALHYFDAALPDFETLSASATVR
jgi:hypothetical protein